jgi:prepilin-type N-terminal cleavage/methylation domain-containing protein
MNQQGFSLVEVLASLLLVTSLALALLQQQLQNRQLLSQLIKREQDSLFRDQVEEHFFVQTKKVGRN